MTMLSVNVNKIALLRNSRGTNQPDLLAFVSHILAAGVRGITVHPRPDERHITRRDVRDIAALLAARHPGVEFNIEGYPSAEFLQLVDEVRPAQCTLVPDQPGQLTSDHGWDVEHHAGQLRDVLEQLRSIGVRSSLFLDPRPDAATHAAAVGTDRVELYTEAYARAWGSSRQAAVWQDYADTAAHARSLGLGLNAGHDLNLDNLADFLRIPHIEEVSIGHALVVESLLQGIDPVIARYLAITGK